MSVDFGRIFGLSARYPFRKDVYLIFFAVQIVFGIAGWLITGYFGGELAGPDGMPIMANLFTFIIYFMPVMIVSFVVTIFLLPAYIDNSAQYFKGKRKDISGGFEVSRKRFLPLLGVVAVIGLILLVCSGGLILLVAAAPDLLSSEGLALVAIGGLWVVVGVVAGIIVVFSTFLSAFFCVLDKQSPLESIRKSWRLVGKHKADTLVFFIIFFVIYLAVAIAVSLPELIFDIFYYTPAALSAESFLLMLLRTAVNTYLALFALSANVGYYLGLKK